MKKHFKIAALFAVLIIILLSSGCKTDSRGAYIYIELPSQPVTVDPQTASTDSELLIVRNIFEGLMRKNESGAVVCGIAKEFETAGLTYTFTLRDDAFWSDGKPVTAEDFVFGFTRAADSATKAPFAERLSSIQNISATDNKTLTITLKADDPLFLDTLTTSVAMPCNEEFFRECVGKYGLESQYIISNGSYSLTKWNKEEFGIRLYRNTKYKGDFEAQNAAAFLSCSDEKDSLALLRDNKVDIAFIDCSQMPDATAAGLTAVGFENTCWVLSVSRDYSAPIRQSLAKLSGSEALSGSLPNGYRMADSLFPAIFKSKASVSGAGVTAYDLAGGKQLFSAEILKLPDKKFPSTVLYYYDNGAVKPSVTALVGHWQQNLGAYINIETVTSPELLTPELQIKTHQMAIFPVSAGNDILSEYIKLFGTQYAGQDLSTLQSSLLGDNTLIPLFFEKTTIAHTTALSEVYPLCENGYVDLSFILKSE